MAEPYIDRTNVVARYKERKFGRNTLLFGRDCEADANSRSNMRQMFDGDMLIQSDLLVSCTGGSGVASVLIIRRKTLWIIRLSSLVLIRTE
jgi:hypothetical protein